MECVVCGRELQANRQNALALGWHEVRLPPDRYWLCPRERQRTVPPPAAEDKAKQ